MAARYSACCKARTGSDRTDPTAAGLVTWTLTGHLQVSSTHRRSSGPSPHRRLCCPVGSTGTIAASDAHPARHPFPGIPVIGHAISDDIIRRSPGRGGPLQFPSSPSIRSEPHTPGSPSRLYLQDLHRFRGLRPDGGGSALPNPHPRAGYIDDAAGFASCYGPHRRSPSYRAFDAGLQRRTFPSDAASLLPGLLAATRAGLTPAGDDELTNTKISYMTSQPLLPSCWTHSRA